MSDQEKAGQRFSKILYHSIKFSLILIFQIYLFAYYFFYRLYLRTIHVNQNFTAYDE
jgi:hypothetical protein